MGGGKSGGGGAGKGGGGGGAMGGKGGSGGLGSSCKGGGSGGNSGGSMKAPGGGGAYISRAGFESNPKGYFGGLHGNHQTGVGFWKAITDKFNAIMEQGPMRDVDSVFGKWRKMSKIINRFSGIYNLYYTNPPSGSNEDDILNLALAKWDEKNKTPYQHIQAWKVLKKENKWKPIPNEVATAKRSKTSESGSYSAGGSTARCHIDIDINDEPEFAGDEFAVHESERPPGRDKAKKTRPEREKRAARTKRLPGPVRKWTS
ncbi:glycine-rich RNA-binding protein 5, mitochondrial-like [Helianthus annuus]|uniref:glycine-rich RNA-binding protein 5, mitochondrial-like n=1 Tax=Helianthus annuus TaxID=4232 RepID=UPI000B8FA16D|nr:glycine-rich RNA-binding protein 5, mitochondrial-like [Helianthus annuus]